MKSAGWILLAVAACFMHGCATSKEPMDSTRYDRAVQKQFDDDYQDRLKP